MIVTKPLGKLSDFYSHDLDVDYLDVEWYVVHKAIDRRKTRNGMDIGVRMNEETKLMGWNQDDVIYKDEEKIIVINILACKCISVTIQEYFEAVKLCYEIGNRHAPLFYGEDEHEFLTTYEMPMMHMIEKLGFEPQIKDARLIPGRRISSAQGHGHTHSHHHGFSQGHSHANLHSSHPPGSGNEETDCG